ncbi:hypothetical protein [Nocardia noduli]|uniref:hypothetical protein n=1 Tax=Nocardia noduli TaxID=2815722 RepID=UPI001C2406B7|nr:hypothetical protein [Nocardia noduli]
MVRVSEHYGISGDQGTLDFIDVEIDRDTLLFIDPAVIASIDGPWENACTSAIQSFFQAVLDCIKNGEQNKAKSLLSRLSEDNSTRLGYSSRNRGSGLGLKLAEEFYKELSSSRAVQSGLIADLEDTALLIDNVGEDRISDVVTNIVRNLLAEYTQAAAEYYGIPLKRNVAMHPYWAPSTKKWTTAYFDLPIAGGSPLLLVPKSIVRKLLLINPGEYYQHYVLTQLFDEELRGQSQLTTALRSEKRPRITKASVDRMHKDRFKGLRGAEKRISLETTEKNPDLIARYKQDKLKNPPAAISAAIIAEVTKTELPDLDALLQTVTSMPGGGGSLADNYEKAIEALLSALLYPSLVNPVRQEKIHEGRKRIDISYTNMGRNDFFYWLSQHYPAANVFIECKNYTRPLKNPEFDQLSGRFSPSRGKYGILVYRGYSDKPAVQRSLKDTAVDDRGYITALDDEDLGVLVDEYKKVGSATLLDGLLHTRFKALTH